VSDHRPSPNPRVQRTRPYASLRGSPLTRHPLGGGDQALFGSLPPTWTSDARPRITRWVKHGNSKGGIA